VHNIWRPKPGDTVVRHPRHSEVIPTVVSLSPSRSGPKKVSAPLALILGFVILVGLGTLGLTLPFANVTGSIPPLTDAVFTATSAVTVTGLIVQNTYEYWTPIGQVIILGLVVVGGMGWMTIAGILIIILRQRVTLQQRMILRDSMGNAQLGNVIRSLRNLVFTFMGIQLLGGVILTSRFHTVLNEDFPQAVWHGMFHAISGFNNAGFTIFPSSDNLNIFFDDKLVLVVMAGLIALGGLGFPVIADLIRAHRFQKFNLDTKFVLVGSIFLWLLGTGVMLALESNGILKDSDGMQLFTNAAFHSISSRAAGFSTVDMGLATPATAFLVIGLMFLGTASSSVGGGIRLNTAGVLFSTVWASMRGNEFVTAFGREISSEQVQRAIAITCLGTGLVFIVSFLMIFTEHRQHSFINLLFEVVSALGTVGLGRGVTSSLSAFGKLLVIASMLIGRLGPLVIGLSLSDRELHPAPYRFPRERINIG